MSRRLLNLVLFAIWAGVTADLPPAGSRGVLPGVNPVMLSCAALVARANCEQPIMHIRGGQRKSAVDKAERTSRKTVQREAGNKGSSAKEPVKKRRKKRLSFPPRNTSDDLRNPHLEAYELGGPKIYKKVYGYRGRKAFWKAVRSDWSEMTEKQMEEKLLKDLHGQEMAIKKTMDEDNVYVNSLPFGELGIWKGTRKGLSGVPKMSEYALTLHEGRKKGLKPTGRLIEKQFGNKTIEVPEMTEDGLYVNPITETVENPYENTRLKRLMEERDRIFAEQRGLMHDRMGQGEGGTQGGVGGEGGEGGTKTGVVARKGNRTLSLVDHLRLLKESKKKMTKAQRKNQYVLGFSPESVERVLNGTFATNSAWGPHKAIMGVQNPVFGEVWGGSRPYAGRKRMDASWFLEGALKGNDKAQYHLGICYAEGLGVEKSYKRAAGWFSKSARQGHVKATYELALCYRYGDGVSKSYTKCRRLLQSASRKGSLPALEDLAVAHLKGKLGLEPNASAAVPLLIKAADRGSKRAMTWVGLMYAEGRYGMLQDDEKAEWYLLRSAREYKEGSQVGKEIRAGARALFKLAQRFAEGRGVKQNYEKAIDWYSRASIKGYSPAFYELGMCYIKGLGVPRDERIGARQLEFCCNRGYSKAFSEFGKMLLEGVGVEQDEARARRTFMMGTLYDDPGSMLRYAECLAKGWGGEINRESALKWFQNAKSYNETAADASLSLFHFLMDMPGGSARSRKKEALQYLSEASSLGNHEASLILAQWILERRDGLSEYDDHEAFTLLNRTAEEAADPESMLWLASCYADGLGTKKDEDEAAIWIGRAIDEGASVQATWLERAAARGSIQAKITLVKLLEKDPTVESLSSLMRLCHELAKLGDPEFRFKYARLKLEEANEGTKLLQWDPKVSGNLKRKGAQEQRLAEVSMQMINEIEAAAAEGHADAMYFLAEAYSGGKHGLDQSDSAAVEWYARASEEGHAKAQFKLGLFYLKGRSMPKDEFMATEWFMEAAEQGDPDAQFALGLCFSKGNGVEKNHELASKFYSAAAHQGHGKAQHNLALRYFDGIGVVKDPTAAVYWFSQAAQQGVLGKVAKVKKGVSKNALKEEMSQRMIDDPRGLNRKPKAQWVKMMKLSEFLKIQWNQKHALPVVQKKADSLVIRQEGKRLPRFVYIDDPKHPKFGKMVATRPEQERRDRVMSLLLEKHELDWETMMMDAELNRYRWTIKELRKKGVKLMERRTSCPTEFLLPRERKKVVQFKTLLAAHNAIMGEKKKATKAVERLLSSEGAENPLRLSNTSRQEQLESSREMLEIFLRQGMNESGRTEMRIEGLRVVMGFNPDDMDRVMEPGEEEEAAVSYPHLLSNTSFSSSSTQLVEVQPRAPRKFAMCKEELGDNGEPSALVLADGSKLPLPSFLRPGFRFSRQLKKQKKVEMRI